MAWQPVGVPPVLFGVLAVISLRTGQAEHPLLDDRVDAVPERQCKAQVVADIGDAGHAVLVPPIGAGPGVVVGEVSPGVAILAVVLSDRPPGTLGEIGPPLVPGVGAGHVVLCSGGRVRQPIVLGGQDRHTSNKLDLAIVTPTALLECLAGLGFGRSDHQVVPGGDDGATSPCPLDDPSSQTNLRPASISPRRPNATRPLAGGRPGGVRPQGAAPTQLLIGASVQISTANAR